VSLQTGSPSSVWGFISRTGQTPRLQTSACSDKTERRRAPGPLAKGHPKPARAAPAPSPSFPAAAQQRGERPRTWRVQTPAASSSSSPAVTLQPRGLCALGLKNQAVPSARSSWRAPRLAALFPHPKWRKQVPAKNRHHQCLNFRASGQALGAELLPGACDPERAAPQRDPT